MKTRRTATIVLSFAADEELMNGMKDSVVSVEEFKRAIESDLRDLFLFGHPNSENLSLNISVVEERE
jgi:hypothetical protein